MNKEFLKMQKLAGLITESQMKTMLNETQSFEDFSDVLLDMAIENNITTPEQSNDSDIIDALFNVWDEMGFERYEETGQGISTSDYNRSLAKFSTLIGNQLNENNDYTPPAYTAINDMMDYIKQYTGVSGRIVPYRSISWLPGVSDTDGDTDMLTYKKGKQEIAIGADDVYQDASDENSNVWIIDSNDPDLYFEEHMTFKEAVKAVSEWLES